MKKITAILLSILCIFSMFTVAASAATAESPLSENEDKAYYIAYKLMPGSGATPLYSPFATVNYKGPGTAFVTNDTPIAVDHDFVYWVDAEGTRYDPGSPIRVDGEIVLYAYMVPKTDNSSFLVRLFRAIGETLTRVFQKALGIFETVDDFIEDYYA